MRIPGSVSFLIALAFLTGLAHGGPEAAPKSAAITERGRTLETILAQIFAPGPAATPRTVVLLVDPTPSLVRARFVERLDAALASARDPSLAIGLAVVGDRRHPRLAPSGDPGPALAVLREVLADPEDAIRNVYAPIRDLVRTLEKLEGAREIVLISLENGDGEDELERTAESLVQANVTLDVIGRPALLSDSYWVRHRAAWARSGKAPPGELDLRGPDSAYDELPWGWILQQFPVATEIVPSGFGMYGLSRLVIRSKGTYFLYYPVSYRAYERCHLGTCPICDGRHADCGRRYEAHRLAALAPSLVSRVEMRKAFARDPLFMAILEVWREAAEEKIVYSRPPLRRGPGLLREDARRLGNWGGLFRKADFRAVGRRAEKLETVCADLAERLGKALAEIEARATTPRTVALAETTRTSLLVTRLNCRLLRAFCDRAGGWRKTPEAGLVAPEIPTLEPGPDSRREIVFRSVPFCHGTAAVREFDLPGLEEAGAVRDEAFAAVDALRTRYDGTPFGRVVRLMGVPIFRLAVPGEAKEYAAEDGHPRGAAAGRTGGGTATGGR